MRKSNPGLFSLFGEGGSSSKESDYSGGTYEDGSNANVDEEQTKDGSETWYYMEKSQGGPHALVYNPNTGIIYDVNHPNNGNTNGLASWLKGGEKSIGYKFDMNDPKQVAAFWKFGGGRGALFLSPITITNPAAATSFFESQNGKEWDYNLFMNNCKHFVITGMRNGGTRIITGGPDPSIWLNSSATLVWHAKMAKPAPVKTIIPYMPQGNWPIMKR
jgi:hypothetical protein